MWGAGFRVWGSGLGEGAIALARSYRALAELVTQGTTRVWCYPPTPLGVVLPPS